MRAAAPLFAAALLLVLAGAAQATHGGPHPTDLTLSVEPLVLGEDARLTATLRHLTTEPVANATIVFERETTFGWLELGQRATNAIGDATFYYRPEVDGVQVLRARFDGSPGLEPSVASVEAVVAGAPAEPAPFPLSTAISVVIAIVVGSIWGSYAFVLLDLRAIRDEGRRVPSRAEASPAGLARPEVALRSTTPRERTVRGGGEK